MKHKLLLVAAVALAFSSCTTYTAPVYTEPANPVDTTGIDANKAKGPALLTYNHGGADVGGYAPDQKVLKAGKQQVGTDTRLELKMQYIRNGQPHTITLVIPDYKGKGVYGKDKKNEYANVTMQIIRNTAPDTTWQGAAKDITVDIVNDNAKYVEINFNGKFDIFTPSVSGSAGTVDIYGTWFMRWEL